MIVVPTPRWIWVAVAVMVLCVIGYIIVGITVIRHDDNSAFVPISNTMTLDAKHVSGAAMADYAAALRVLHERPLY